ncbi:MAG: insulinase family protein [Lewinellaceae bacterium]|nr:insulinase family protein [Phaeodactylibacter sp.]MCB9350725.1 insulinase family protein [Lewinellaceae bacterium]
MKQFLILCLLSVVLLISAGARAQENKIAFDKYTLDNGLTVILHQDKSTPIVAIAVMYHVGSKNEDPSRTGFAHFFEHLLFEGSENIERGEFVNYIQDAGGTLNAYTTNDNTCYFEILPSNQLELGLWLESERMLQAKVDQKGVETQREVVKEEMRMRYDNRPYGSFQKEISKRLYQQYPYMWTPIGSMDHLNAASEEDYVKFYKQFYVPNNAVLVIAGDIEPQQAREWVSKYFKGIPKREGDIYRPQVKEPPLGKQIRDTIFDAVQLPGIFKAYRTPAIGEKDFYAVNMLARLLSEGESSRLKKALVDEQQLAIQTGNFVDEREGPSLALAYAIGNAGVDALAVEKAMNAEVEKVQKEGVTEEEFQKLRNQVESQFVSQNATVFGIANNLATYEVLYGDANLINEEIGRYMAVTREDIQNAAKKYFVDGNSVVLYYLPKPNQP